MSKPFSGTVFLLDHDSRANGDLDGREWFERLPEDVDETDDKRERSGQ